VVITDIKTKAVGGFSLVEVQTDEGIVGIGAVDSYPPLVKCLIDPGNGVGPLKELLVGENPLEMGRLWEKMYRGSFWYGHRGVVVHAMSGIDIALWDISGKALGMPIYQLLGGSERGKVRPYASLTPFSRPREDEVRESALRQIERCLEMGFKAIKLGWGEFHTSLEVGVELMRTAREIAGPEIEIIVDVGRPWDWNVATAIQRIEAVAEYGILWVEEPLPADDISGYAELRQALKVPVSCGEVQCTRFPFKELLDRRAVDILQPDVCRVGGITELKRIAELAKLHNVLCVPHCWSTAICIAASAHVVASIPNGLYVEFQVMSPLNTELLSEPFKVVDGWMELPKGPGLGIELDPEVLKKYSR